MIKIKPFKALRPQPQVAKNVASKPYDVLNFDEAKAEIVGNPNSFLFVTKSEISLPKNISNLDLQIYEQAKENLFAFIKKNILFAEIKPCFYIYRLKIAEHIQTGLVCLSSLLDYENNLIKKHELTRPIKEQDRLLHIKYTQAHTGNVFLTYKPVQEIDAIISNWQLNRNPIYDFTTDDNVNHTLWAINENEVIDNLSKLFYEKVSNTYIADGHHRAASAYRYFKEFENSDNVEASYFLTTLFPTNQVKILPYNRIVKSLNNLTKEIFFDKLSNKFEVEEIKKGKFISKPSSFGLYINYKWYKITPKKDKIEFHNLFDSLLTKLDVSILQDFILSEILNIDDPRTNENLDFIGGDKSLEDIESIVNSKKAKMAFCLHPVHINDLIEIADNNLIMPPKSTWFEPKVRDGILTHKFDSNE